MMRTIQYSFPSKADGLEISCLAVVPNGQAGVLFEPQPTNCVA